MAVALAKPQKESRVHVDFPWLVEVPVLAHAFRNNIRSFLSSRASRVPVPGLHRVSAYIIELQSPQGPTLLHVYEELLDDKDGAVCDECRCMGEHGGPVAGGSSSLSLKYAYDLRMGYLGCDTWWPGCYRVPACRLSVAWLQHYASHTTPTLSTAAPGNSYFLPVEHFSSAQHTKTGLPWA